MNGAKTFVEGHSHPFVTPQEQSQGNKYLHPPNLFPTQQTQLEARGKEVCTCQSSGTSGLASVETEGWSKVEVGFLGLDGATTGLERRLCFG